MVLFDFWRLGTFDYENEKLISSEFIRYTFGCTHQPSGNSYIDHLSDIRNFYYNALFQFGKYIRP